MGRRRNERTDGVRAVMGSGSWWGEWGVALTVPHAGHVAEGHAVLPHAERDAST